MVDFVRLQEIVKNQLEQDRTVKTLSVRGPTLEAAVAEAATLLNVPVHRIEYEIIERGFPGFLGAGRKEWQIQAYEDVRKKAEKAGAGLEAGEDLVAAELAPVVEDRDGEIFVHLSSDGVFVKVTAPSGNGKPAEEREAYRKLELRKVREYDKDMVSKVLKEAAGEYVRVGDFSRVPANDSIMQVEITDQEMKGWITVFPPGPGGCDVSEETYLSFLRNNRVIYGINEAFIKEFADKTRYKEKVLVAEGTKPIDGRDAYIQYNFETDQNVVHIKEDSSGKVDFKSLNIIQNVVANQPLAKKIPPELGIPGKTVTGKTIPAKNGRDIPLPAGKNVHADKDTIYADINGQVVLTNQNINVEPVYNVDGDVNLKTGNIIFLGTVVIKGNVEAGFSVKAAGNIEVKGTVEKADLDAEGDIIVHQGITGKHSGLIRAGRSIWARFIENSIIEAGNMVVVSDGIVNSEVDAFRKIICQGKRAHVVGGRLRSTEEINVKILGSGASGTETICEVGIDPKTKERFARLNSQKMEMVKKLDEVQRNLQSLIKIKRQRKALPEEKEEALMDLMDKRKIFSEDLEKVNEELKEVEEILEKISVRGKVSASDKVYPGVKVVIKDAVMDVHSEYRGVTFVLENSLIRAVKYEEPDEEAKRGPTTLIGK